MIPVFRNIWLLSIIMEVNYSSILKSNMIDEVISARSKGKEVVIELPSLNESDSDSDSDIELQIAKQMSLQESRGVYTPDSFNSLNASSVYASSSKTPFIDSDFKSDNHLFNVPISGFISDSPDDSEPKYILSKVLD
jgi:hypothetical protein